MVQLQVLVGHAAGGETFTGALEGAGAVASAEVTLIMQTANHISQTGSVIFTKVDRGVSPNLAKRGNVVSDNRTAGECGLERRQAEGFVARGSHKDRRPAV